MLTTKTVKISVLMYKSSRWFGKSDSKVGSPPSAGTRETLGGHLHFIWDTPESLVFHFSYTCHSLVPLSFTRLSLVGHLVSKVSSECFITDLLCHGSQPIQSTHQLFGFQQRLYLVLSPLCHSKSLSVLSGSQCKHSLFTVNDCCPLADFGHYLFTYCYLAA